MFNPLRRRRDPATGSITSGRDPVQADAAPVDSAPTMTRRRSEETMFTLVDETSGAFNESTSQQPPAITVPNHQRELSPPPPYSSSEDSWQDGPDLASLFTTDSDETIFNDMKVFSKPISKYTKRREFPIVSNFLQQGVMVFQSPSLLQGYQREMKHNANTVGISPTMSINPMLHSTVPVMGIFKKNAPFMIIYKYDDAGKKEEYCKIYFKVLENNLTAYILVFLTTTTLTSPVVLLNNNSCKPSVDATILDTKIRISGISGASTFASGYAKTFIMKDTSPNISDNMLVTYNEKSIIKSIKIATSPDNELARLLIQNKSNSNAFKNLMNGRPQIHVPFATFIDNGDKRIGSMLIRHGTINCFDEPGEKVSENTLILTCVHLVLREQEYRKNKGTNKPTYVGNPMSHAVYNGFTTVNGIGRDF